MQKYFGKKKVIISLVVIVLVIVAILFKYESQSSGEFQQIENKFITDTSTSVYNKYWAEYDTKTKLVYLEGDKSSLSPLYGQVGVEERDKYKNTMEFKAVEDNTIYTIGPKSTKVYVTYDSITGIVYFKTNHSLVPIFNKEGIPMMKEEFYKNPKNFDRFKGVSSKSECTYDIGTAYHDTSTDIVYLLVDDSICAIFNKNGKAMSLDEFIKNNNKNRFKKLDTKYNERSVYCDEASKVLYLKENHYMTPLYKTSTEIMTNTDIS
ncbi:hypothetical protein [Clostridium sp. C2-6-12]|uniref:hypothetical protein n=1 Tax=Clostridium sp. C2-6-12 TaxID=2698832 RepID=UPI0013693A48|nr:hypothetical protein [Clostridium sp. C2-6-12]